MVILVAYKGSGKKARIQGSGVKRSEAGMMGIAKSIENFGAPKPKRNSKSQDSRKVHDTKGKNNHGRSSW